MEELAELGSASSTNLEMEAITDHLFLPEKEELDKLLRYEAMINRQLNHAIAEFPAGLHPLQREFHRQPILLRNKAKKVFDFSNPIG